MNIGKIVFIQTSLIHYHYPRMRALAEECRKAGIVFCNIELAGDHQADPRASDGQDREFININLFPGKRFESIPENILWTPLRNQLDELKPDVVFITGYSLGVMRKATFWAQRKGVATVLLIDSNIFDKKRFRVLEFVKSRFVMRFDAAFVAGTSSSSYAQRLGIPAERIVPGCDVIDVAAFSRSASEIGKAILQVRQKWNLPERYFLYVGRLVKEKNLPTLLEAYQEYLIGVDQEADPWMLVICGSGPEEARLRQWIDARPCQVKERILLYGYIKQPDIIDFFTCASWLVFPSISEPWGLVVNEALACSLPVIVSNRAGSSFDLVKTDVNGWIVDPYDVKELASLMLKVSRIDESDRIEKGLQGKELISEWGLEKFTRGVLESAQIALAHRDRRFHH